MILNSANFLLRKKHFIIAIGIIAVGIFAGITISNMTNPSWQINNFVNRNSQHVNFYSIDIYRFRSRKEIIINGSLTYFPASLTKVPVMLAYYKLAQKHPEVLQENLVYTASVESMLTQNILPGKALQTGKPYTVDALIAYMIEYSDNRAMYALINNLNSNILRKVFSHFGLTIDLSDRYYRMSVVDYAKFFKGIYSGVYLGKDLSQKAIMLLDKSEFRSGLVAGVPRGVQVADKFGERILSNQGIVEYHECGIVYRIAHPYLLCVMTEGDDLRSQEGFVKNLSSFVYRMISGRAGITIW